MNDVEKDLVARHAQLHLHNANEAETRKKLIDRIELLCESRKSELTLIRKAAK